MNNLSSCKKCSEKDGSGNLLYLEVDANLNGKCKVLVESSI